MGKFSRCQPQPLLNSKLSFENCQVYSFQQLTLQCLRKSLILFMSIDNLPTNITPISEFQGETNEFQQRDPLEQANNGLEALNETPNTGENMNMPMVQEVKVVDYRDPQVVEYFKSKEVLGKRWQQMSNNLVIVSQSQVDSQIKSGAIRIPKSSKELGKPQDSPKADKAGNIKTILSKKVNLQMQLKSIQDELNKIGQIKEQKEELADGTSEIQRKKFVERMVKVRKVAENRRRAMLEYEQQKIEKEIKKEEEERRLSEEKIKQEKEKTIKEKLQEKQKLKQQHQEEQKQSLLKYKDIFSQKRKYQIMKEKYQASVVLPMLQEQKQILKERSARFKGFSIDQIRSFQRQYDKSREEKMSQNSNSSKLTVQYKPPSYYNHKIHKLLEEEKVKQKVRLQNEKRALQQKIERQANYAQYVKESIAIKIDEKKKLELALINKQKKSKQKSKVQLINMGNSYMHQNRLVKSELRKDNYSTRQEKTEVSKEEKKKLNTAMNQGEHDKFMREAHKERINRILASKSIEKGEKIEKLKAEANKLSQRIRRNEQIRKVRPLNKESGQNIEEMLANIKAKIGMMDLLKQ